jgi:hypothetical protein
LIVSRSVLAFLTPGTIASDGVPVEQRIDQIGVHHMANFEISVEREQEKRIAVILRLEHEAVRRFLGLADLVRLRSCRCRRHRTGRCCRAPCSRGLSALITAAPSLMAKLPFVAPHAASAAAKSAAGETAPAPSATVHMTQVARKMRSRRIVSSLGRSRFDIPLAVF